MQIGFLLLNVSPGKEGEVSHRLKGTPFVTETIRLLDDSLKGGYDFLIKVEVPYDKKALKKFEAAFYNAGDIIDTRLLIVDQTGQLKSYYRDASNL